MNQKASTAGDIGYMVATEKLVPNHMIIPEEDWKLILAKLTERPMQNSVEVHRDVQGRYSWTTKVYAFEIAEAMREAILIDQQLGEAFP